jgi:hypothetical protein
MNNPRPLMNIEQKFAYDSDRYKKVPTKYYRIMKKIIHKALIHEAYFDVVA